MRNESTTPEIIVTTPEQIGSIVRRVLLEVLAKGEATSDWIDAKAVGAMLNVHPRSVRKLRGLPHHRFGAKLLRYRRAEVQQWAETQGRAVQK